MQVTAGWHQEGEEVRWDGKLLLAEELIPQIHAGHAPDAGNGATSENHAWIEDEDVPERPDGGCICDLGIMLWKWRMKKEDIYKVQHIHIWTQNMAPCRTGQWLICFLCGLTNHLRIKLPIKRGFLSRFLLICICTTRKDKSCTCFHATFLLFDVFGVLLPPVV